MWRIWFEKGGGDLRLSEGLPRLRIHEYSAARGAPTFGPSPVPLLSGIALLFRTPRQARGPKFATRLHAPQLPSLEGEAKATFNYLRKKHFGLGVKFIHAKTCVFTGKALNHAIIESFNRSIYSDARKGAKPAVNRDAAAGGERGGGRAQVGDGADQFLRLTIAFHGCLAEDISAA